MTRQRVKTSAIPPRNVQVRTVRPAEELRWNELMQQHHYLGIRKLCCNRLRKGALPRLWSACASFVSSIPRLLRVKSIKRTMCQVHLRPDSAVQLLLGWRPQRGLCTVSLALARPCCVSFASHALRPSAQRPQSTAAKLWPCLSVPLIVVLQQSPAPSICPPSRSSRMLNLPDRIPAPAGRSAGPSGTTAPIKAKGTGVPSRCTSQPRTGR